MSKLYSVHKDPSKGGSGGHFGTFLCRTEAWHLLQKLRSREPEERFSIRRASLGASQDVLHLMEDYDA